MRVRLLQSRFDDAVEFERQRFQARFGRAEMRPGVLPEAYTEHARAQREVVAASLHREDLVWRDLLLERVFTVLAEPTEGDRARGLAQVAAVCEQMFEGECGEAGRALL